MFLGPAKDVKVAMLDGLHVSIASLQLMLCSSLTSSAQSDAHPMPLNDDISDISSVVHLLCCSYIVFVVTVIPKAKRPHT